MTNYKRIKNMTMEEMAVTLMCPNEMGMAEIDCDKLKTCRAGVEVNCCQCLLDWLQEEASNES